MLREAARSRFDIDPRRLHGAFDREPFGFQHGLHESELFAFDSLRELALGYAAADSFVAAGAPSPETPFYAVEHGALTPVQALDRLDYEPRRVLLKRPETYDARFRVLLDELFARVVERRGGLGGERVVRLESAIFVSPPGTITPFHFDPEITFFFQVQGNKRYHVFLPESLREQELERFYVKGIINIGQVDLDARDPQSERVFDLVPGTGMYQPQNAPHWVEATGLRSISYTFSFETDAMRAANRTRSFNHYERRLGLQPSRPGARPGIDAIKAGAMRFAIPARKGLARVARLTGMR